MGDMTVKVLTTQRGFAEFFTTNFTEELKLKCKGGGRGKWLNVEANPQQFQDIKELNLYMTTNQDIKILS